MVKQETVHGVDAIKRKDASVVKKGFGPAVPADQWEMRVNPMPAGIPNDPAGAFLAMEGKKRPVPHKKINEYDY